MVLWLAVIMYYPVTPNTFLSVLKHYKLTVIQDITFNIRQRPPFLGIFFK